MLTSVGHIGVEGKPYGYLYQLSKEQMMLTLVASLVIATLHLCNAIGYWDPSDPTRLPLVAAELGFGIPEFIRESSEEAFRAGLALGATSVEVTAKLTKNGFIALEHDAEVLNDAALPELIITSESNFDELKTGTLELETFIDIVRGHGMNIMIQKQPIGD